jgi:hypothetical protein
VGEVLTTTSIDAELHTTDLATLRKKEGPAGVDDPNKRTFKLIQDEADKSLYVGPWCVYAQVAGVERDLAGRITECKLVRDAYYVLKVKVGNKWFFRVYASPEVPIFLEGPAEVGIYETAEFKIRLSDKFFHHWTMIINGTEKRNDAAGTGGRNVDDLHDAYDADADGNKIEVDLQFQRQGETAWHQVPAFAMKETFDGKWEFRARPAFNTAGTYKVQVLAQVQHTDLCKEHQPQNAADDEAKWVTKMTTERVQRQPKEAWLHKFTKDDYTTDDKDKRVWANAASMKIEVKPNANARGRLFRPDGGRYFFVEKPVEKQGDTGQEVFLGIGLSRPWVVDQTRTVDRKPAKDPAYFGNEYVDYTNEYLVPMQKHGMNMTALWMCNWATLPVHTAKGEYWPTAAKPWACPPIPKLFAERTLELTHHYAAAFYDQGRCSIMDKYTEEADARGIRYLLTFFSHDALRLKSGGIWDSGLYDGIDSTYFLVDGTAATGFSQLGSGKPEDFFSCAADRNSRFWLYQQNYYRYLFARWGSSRSVAMIEPLAEWEGAYWAGWDTIDDFRKEVLAWGNAVRAFWHGLENSAGRACRTPFTISTFQVSPECLQRSIDNLDCLNAHGYYAGEVPGSPLPRYSRKVNCWAAVEADRRNDWTMSNWHWRFLAQRYRAFAITARGKGQPCVLGEVAMSERPNYEEPWYYTGWDGTDAGKKLGKWYPTYYHRTLWVGLATGQAVLPLKWCDGKVQGEARAVADRTGFTGGQLPPKPPPPPKEEYPFDLFACVDPIWRFLSTPEPKHPQGSVRERILPRLQVLDFDDARIKAKPPNEDEVFLDDPNDDHRTMKAHLVASGAKTPTGKCDAYIGYVIRLEEDPTTPAVKPGAWLEFRNAEPGGEWVARWYNPGTGESITGNAEVTEDKGVVKVKLPTDPAGAKVLWGGLRCPVNAKVGWYAESETDLVVKVFKAK